VRVEDDNIMVMGSGVSGEGSCPPVVSGHQQPQPTRWRVQSSGGGLILDLLFLHPYRINWAACTAFSAGLALPWIHDDRHIVQPPQHAVATRLHASTIHGCLTFPVGAVGLPIRV